MLAAEAKQSTDNPQLLNLSHELEELTTELHKNTQEIEHSLADLEIGYQPMVEQAAEITGAIAQIPDSVSSMNQHIRETKSDITNQNDKIKKLREKIAA